MRHTNPKRERGLFDRSELPDTLGLSASATPMPKISIRADQRLIDHVLGDEPDLHFVRANDVAD